jgi:hypothetical protein
MYVENETGQLDSRDPQLRHRSNSEQTNIANKRFDASIRLRAFSLDGYTNTVSIHRMD